MSSISESTLEYNLTFQILYRQTDHLLVAISYLKVTYDLNAHASPEIRRTSKPARVPSPVLHKPATNTGCASTECADATLATFAVDGFVDYT